MNFLGWNGIGIGASSHSEFLLANDNVIIVLVGFCDYFGFSSPTLIENCSCVLILEQVLLIGFRWLLFCLYLDFFTFSECHCCS